MLLLLQVPALYLLVGSHKARLSKRSWNDPGGKFGNPIYKVNSGALGPSRTYRVRCRVLMDSILVDPPEI